MRPSLLLLLLACAAQAQTQVRIGVLSLFHPQTLTLTTSSPILLDGTPHHFSAPLTVRALGPSDLEVDSTLTAHTLTVPGPSFTLTVPGKLTRTYRGSLLLTTRAGILRPVVLMLTETAVASIVQAESPPNAPFEALRAQSIASRSFLLATPHPHTHFDACDTTHCQFLPAPPLPDSPAARATVSTAGLVLTWLPTPTSPPRIVPARFSRACGGHTLPHPNPHDPTDYPFYPVPCAFCLRHPGRPPQGHSVGLCQLGAADLATHGRTAPQILAHFFPNTHLTRLP